MDYLKNLNNQMSRLDLVRRKGRCINRNCDKLVPLLRRGNYCCDKCREEEYKIRKQEELVERIKNDR